MNIVKWIKSSKCYRYYNYHNMEQDLMNQVEAQRPEILKLIFGHYVTVMSLTILIFYPTFNDLLLFKLNLKIDKFLYFLRIIYL